MRLPSTHAMRLLALCAGAAAGACGDDVTCGDGTTLADGVCVAAAADGGLPACGPGTAPDEDGVCQVSARPSDGQGCEGRFGPIAEDQGGVVYVDGAWSGGAADGSAARPFSTIQAGVDAALDGETVAVAAGTYTEAVTIGKPLTLIGRCARQVTIAQVATGTPAAATITVTTTDAVGIAGVTITRGAPGVHAVDSGGGAGGEVWLLHARVEGNTAAGLDVVRSTLSFTEGELVDTVGGPGARGNDGAVLTVRRSTVSGNGGGGVELSDVNPDGAGGWVRTAAASVGFIEENDLVDNGASAVRVHDARNGTALVWDDVPDAFAPVTAVRRNAMRGHTGFAVTAAATSIWIDGNDVDADAAATVTDRHGAVSLAFARGVVAANTIGLGAPQQDLAVDALSSSGVVAGNTVTGGASGVEAFGSSFEVVGNSFSDQAGFAVWAVGSALAGPFFIEENNVVGGLGGGYTEAALYVQDHADVVVRGNVVEDSVGVGIYVTGARVGFIEENRVVDTVSSTPADDGSSGHGLVLNGCAGLRVFGNDVIGNAGTGLLLLGSASDDPFFIEENDAVDNGWVGIDVAYANNVTLFGNVSADNAVFGIRVLGDGASTGRAITLDSNVVVRSLKRAAADDAGDGIALVGADALVRQNDVRSNQRAGVGSTGGVGFIEENNTVFVNGEYSGFFQDGDAMTVPLAGFSPPPTMSGGHLEDVNITVGGLVSP